MVNEMDLNEIEMNDLVGHAKYRDEVSSVENGDESKERRSHRIKRLGRQSKLRMRMRPCHTVAAIFILLATILFVFDKIPDKNKLEESVGSSSTPSVATTDTSNEDETREKKKHHHHKNKNNVNKDGSKHKHKKPLDGSESKGSSNKIISTVLFVCSDSCDSIADIVKQQFGDDAQKINVAGGNACLMGCSINKPNEAPREFKQTILNIVSTKTNAEVQAITKNALDGNGIDNSVSLSPDGMGAGAPPAEANTEEPDAPAPDATEAEAPPAETNAVEPDASAPDATEAETAGVDDKNIIGGVDDKDIYCEDLSIYQEWHDTKITKADGVMYRVVKQMNHDKTSFTQGLTYAKGKLFESAGLYGKSSVRILDRNSADVEWKVPMPKELFAEGMTYYKDTLVQITWKSQRAFIYNITNLEEIDTFNFETTVNEGWGITWDRCNDELIVTDGSQNLHFWDPKTMKETRRVSVTRIDGSKALEMNEIEFWRGRVLANIWYEDVILVINPETGVVEKEYDFSQLWPKFERRKARADVLNGISISEDPNTLYFTGKLWDRMYSIQLLPDL